MTTAAPAANPGATPALNPETHDLVTGKTWKQIAEDEKAAREAAERPPKTDSDTTTLSREEQVRRWKKDKEDKFANDPIGTIAEMVGEGAHSIVRGTTKQIAEAQKAIRAVKGELSKKYKESFAKFEDEFDQEVESLSIGEQADKAVLVEVFHTVRGRHFEEGGAPKAPETPTGRIVGPTEPGSGAGAPGGPAAEPTLTPAQQAEYEKSGLSSIKVYLQRLEERRARAKAKGFKIPDTLGEPLHA